MLTRLEIDGFKSFENFQLDLSPFTVVLGSNASGKSNLFDAVQLLSRLAGGDVRSAFRGLRGDPELLFRQMQPGRPSSRLRFSAEMLLDPFVQDPWGEQVELGHTRVRYEVAVERVQGESEIPRLIVADERAVPIFSKDDTWVPYRKQIDPGFRERFLKYTRRAPWLEMEDENGKRVFRVHQDGKAGRTRPGHAAEATVMSSIATAEFPHLYAMRKEMRAWRLLQLDPFGLRKPSPLTADETLLPDGSNLAAVLYRIKSETRNIAVPKGALADIAGELSEIIPGVLDVDVDRDDAAREYRALVSLRDGFEFNTSVISDGTLRVLALLTLLHDPAHRGVVCFEEPENGVHPARLRTLIEHLQRLIPDPTEALSGTEDRLSQLLMNSHSPVVLSAVRDQGDRSRMYLADLVTITEPGTETVRRKTRLRPIVVADDKDQQRLVGLDNSCVSRYEVQSILDTVNREA